MTEQEPTYESKKKHLYIIIGLVVFNLLSYNLFVKTGGYDASGQYLPYDPGYALKASLITFLVSVPFVSFMLGLLVGIFPFKKLSYPVRYTRASLLTLLTFNGLAAVGFCCVIALTAIGSYPPPQEPATANNPINKEQRIQDFKIEILALCDSSIYYFDWALDAAASGQDPDEISARISPKLNSLESQLDAKSRGFQRTATELGLTELEFNTVLNEVNNSAQAMMEKHRALKEVGIELR